jgi:DNA-binding winged helix-turn-helix (wHTH) protein/DNA-binding CsgD family transcriptional regulator
MPKDSDHPDVARLMVRADPESTDPIEGRSQNHEQSLSYEGPRRSKTPSVDDVHRKLRFGPFELSKMERVLRRDGVVLPLGSRALDILIYLAERPGTVIGKKELIDHVWSGISVEEGSLRVHISAIRKALDEGHFGHRYIANVQGRGYSFVSSVTSSEGDAVSRSDIGAPAAWVGREPPAVAAGLIDMLAQSLDLDLVFVRSRDPNGKVAAHFARGNACLALGDWLQDRLTEGGRLSRMEIVPSTGDDVQGGAESTHCEVLPFPESRLSGCDDRSGYGRSAQSSCLARETLTARERDILAMIGRGLSNERIARAREISPETVKSHVKRIFLKLAVSTRAQAVSQAGSLERLRSW